MLKKDFKNIYEWFAGNKIIIYFGDDNTKSFIFACEHEIKSVCR